jgi:hypothetical protein
VIRCVPLSLETGFSALRYAARLASIAAEL